MFGHVLETGKITVVDSLEEAIQRADLLAYQCQNLVERIHGAKELLDEGRDDVAGIWLGYLREESETLLKTAKSVNHWASMPDNWRHENKA